MAKNEAMKGKGSKGILQARLTPSAKRRLVWLARKGHMSMTATIEAMVDVAYLAAIRAPRRAA